MLLTKKQVECILEEEASFEPCEDDEFPDNSTTCMNCQVETPELCATRRRNMKRDWPECYYHDIKG